ncbi:MAG: type III polyketide synthase [Planctomycetota bacterium]|jgi:alpha-pyrone synthase|nr:type III polyketide synthase [Planctomycetota bacterium]
MTTAHIQRIATAVPPHDVHQAFIDFARTMLDDPRAIKLFNRMVDKAQISHRYAVLEAAEDPTGAAIDTGGFYTRGRFPSTAERMRLYEQHAPALAARAVAGLELGPDARRVTHLIITSCTGMVAPGIDLQLIDICGLNPSVERTMVGFMGCYAAINALKLAHHIVRSEPHSRVLTVNIELCSLHLQQTTDLEHMLSFLLFADGCSASLIGAEAVGLAMDTFHAVVMPNTADLITWKVRDAGFNMLLSGHVPAAIRNGLRANAGEILGDAAPIDHWAVHPGGRSVLDAVEQGLELAPENLAASRAILDSFGNMSSATVMFVLQSMLNEAVPGKHGCAMSFGPGLSAETMRFHSV